MHSVGENSSSAFPIAVQSPSTVLAPTLRRMDLILADYELHPWAGLEVNAMNLPFEDGTVDGFICSHVIHHLCSPASFLRAASAKLRPGGRIIIQEIHTSYLMRLLLRLMRHEGSSY